MSSERAASPYRIRFLHRPGRTMGNAEIAELARSVRETAETCFEELPPYQVLLGTREAFSDKVLTVAEREDGTMAGFCSAVLLPIPGVGRVFHTGLTCVRPEDRSSGLTHKLTSKAALTYLLRFRPLSKVWMTNVACVLSSLGNIALHFDEVYPTPAGTGASDTHRRIAQAIAEFHREKIFVRPDAEFDPERFVFRGGNLGNCFAKRADDARYHHRDAGLNRFYSERLNWEAGDVQLQVGTFSALTGLNYFARRSPVLQRVLAATGRTPTPAPLVRPA